MSPDTDTVNLDIEEWVERARHDPHKYRERQATEVLLAAICASTGYGDRLYLKGGTLMGLLYRSPRQTADLDFTADLEPTENLEADLRASLDPELRRAAARLGYPDLVCRIQSTRKRPRPNQFADAQFPALDMNIGYAIRDTPSHRRLQRNQCPDILKVEMSFREPVHAITLVRLADTGYALHTYSLIDLIAEKLRALLQQESRKRNRRQDIYDIDFLIHEAPPSPAEQQEILEASVEKAKARGITPTIESLSADEVRERAAEEWHTLGLEISELPEFAPTYDRVERFYRSLPWQEPQRM